MRHQRRPMLTAVMLLVLCALTSGCQVVEHKMSSPFVGEVVRTEVIPPGAKRGVSSYRIAWHPAFVSVTVYGGLAAAVLTPTWLAVRELRRRKLQQPAQATVLPDAGATG